MSDITIRLATPEDAGALTYCIQLAYSPYLAKGIDLPPVADGIAGDIANNHVWVAINDDQIIGGLVLIITDKFAKLANVAVSPFAKGHGVGRALIAQCERAAVKAGHSKLHLATHKDMPENVAMYEHLNWKISAQDGNKILMEKALAL